MASLGERLQQVMAMRAVSASKLSLDAGLSRTAVQKIIDRGGARTSSETISKLATAARVDREWLESGRGDPSLPSRPAITLEREPEHIPADDEVPLETAALRVMDRDRHTLRDLDAVRAAIHAGPRKEIPDADLGATALRFLDAARSIRLEGDTATPSAILWRVAVGRHQREAEVVAELDRADADEAAAELRAHGYEPGQGRANLEAKAAQMRAAQAKKARRGE